MLRRFNQGASLIQLCSMEAGSPFFEEKRVAERAAREAGEIIMALYGKDFQVIDKGKNDPVTTADLEANARIREIVRAHYTGDGWLSEENRDDGKRLQSRRVWIVDPIDGTKEFIQKVPQFAVSIGLAVDGLAVVGVVYNPVEGQLFAAGKGQGATLNGHPVRISPREQLEGALLLVSRSEPKRKFRVLEKACRLEPVGSIAYRMALVAEGRGDGTLTFRSVHEWDICAGTIIVEEAGGTVVDGAGRKLCFNQRDTVLRGMVASNSALVRDLQSLWARTMAGTV